MLEILPGAEPWAYAVPDAATDASPGVVVIHGFTGNPGSMRGLAEAFAAAGFNVEMPRLPGHGTTVEDMSTTAWADWLAEAEAAYQRVAARSSTVVVAGLSMGGSLTLRLGVEHPEIIGLVCINPATQPQAPEVIAVFQGMIDGGTMVAPGIGSDIADPAATEGAYDGAPLQPLISLMTEGLAPLADSFGAMRMPLLLLTSPNDHVVEPAQGDFLAANYGGPIERVSLERSFHVATLDYDKQLIFDRSVQFAAGLTSQTSQTSQAGNA